MHKCNIGANLITIIKSLYEKATSAVLYNGNTGDLFRTTVGVRQGCLLSPTLFNIFLEKIMTDALENHEGTVKIDGRIITNLHFADDIDGLARKKNWKTSSKRWRQHQQRMAWKLAQRKQRSCQTMQIASQTPSR